MYRHAITVLVAFFEWSSVGYERPLPEKLVDVTVAHIRSTGPDEDAAQFIATERFTSWERREEIADATVSDLQSKQPDKVSGALAVLYRLRACRPMNDLIGLDESAWEQIHRLGPFWAKLDEYVVASIEHVYSLGNAGAFRNVALYLGVSPSQAYRRELLRIASDTPAKEQALVCLTWHRDQNDMNSLVPFMLEDSPASRSLPYHFRSVYGAAAVGSVVPFPESYCLDEGNTTLRFIQGFGGVAYL